MTLPAVIFGLLGGAARSIFRLAAFHPVLAFRY
jgi:hypothetical protein